MVTHRSPGYALSLVSTSSTGAIHCSEALSQPGTLSTPEEVALHASRSLLCEIRARGCIDRSHQAMVLLLMAAGPEDVGQVRMGSLTANAVQMLRDIQTVFGVRFTIKPLESGKKGQAAAKRARQEDTEEGEEAMTATTDGQEYILSCFGAAVRGGKRAA